MAMVIHEDCINCGSCEPACPNQAISAGDTVYLINRERCTECVGAFDHPQCVDSCPIEGYFVQNPWSTPKKGEKCQKCNEAPLHW